MFSKINTILGTIDAYVWGIPLIVLILAVGLFLRSEEHTSELQSR